MAVVQRTATTVWNGDLPSGKGVLSGNSGALSDLGVSWPARTEGSNGMTSPEELVAAAHASCYAMALTHTIGQAGHTPGSVEVTATVDLAPKDGGGFEVTKSALTVVGTVDGLSDDEFVKIAGQAEQGCPISNLIRGNAEITLNASLK